MTNYEMQYEEYLARTATYTGTVETREEFIANLIADEAAKANKTIEIEARLAETTVNPFTAIVASAKTRSSYQATKFDIRSIKQIFQAAKATTTDLEALTYQYGKAIAEIQEHFETAARLTVNPAQYDPSKDIRYDND